MKKTTNLIILEVKENISNIISESKLPATIVAMIMHELTLNVDNQTNQIISKEKKEYEDLQLEVVK